MARELKAGAVLLVLAGAGALCFPPLWRPFMGMPDDSYFYFQVARNIHRGLGSTFHGLTPTNGYHPLWMLCCVGAFHLGFGNPERSVRWALLLQQVLAAGTIGLFYGAAREAGLRYALPAAGVVLIYLFTGMFGSEAHLNAFCTMLACWLALRSFRETPPEAVRLASVGAAAGFCVLARLDNVFVAGSILATVWLVQTRRSGSPARAVRYGFLLALPALVPVILYLGWNVLHFGHLMPISGAIKSTFPALRWNPGGLSLLGRLVFWTALAALLLAAGIARRRPAAARVLTMLAPGVLLHVLYVAGMTRGFTLWSWYYVPGVLLLGMTLAALAELWPGRPVRPAARRTARAAALLATAGCFAFALFRVWTKAVNPNAIDYHNPVLIQPRVADLSWETQMAYWLRDRLPPGSRLMMWDLPGVCGFMSGHAVVPADGLMNDYAYNDDLHREGAAAWLRRRRIRYWVGPLLNPGAEQPPREGSGWRIRRDDGGHWVELKAPLYPERGAAGAFYLPDGHLLADLRDVLEHPHTPPVGVWRLFPEQGVFPEPASDGNGKTGTGGATSPAEAGKKAAARAAPAG